MHRPPLSKDRILHSKEEMEENLSRWERLMTSFYMVLLFGSLTWLGLALNAGMDLSPGTWSEASCSVWPYITPCYDLYFAAWFIVLAAGWALYARMKDWYR